MSLGPAGIGAHHQNRRTYLTVTSIDIGSAHFAVYVERVPIHIFEEWKKAGGGVRAAWEGDAPGQCQWRVVWDLRARRLGQVADDHTYDRPAALLTMPLPTTTTVPADPHQDDPASLDENFAPSDSRVPWTHRHLLWNLRRHHYLWAASDQILIERQLNCNPRAIRLETVCTTYFCLFCPAGVRVDSYPARYKTCILGGGPVGRDQKSARKTWAKNQALALSERRNDANLAAWFRRPLIKKDDLADAMLMVQAWKHQQRLPASHPAHWSKQSNRKK